MFNPDSELIFPIRLLSEMKNLRGEHWGLMIEKTMDMNVDVTYKVTMTLLIAKINGCITCNSDSYRANRGCKLCSQQAIKRCKNSDIEFENMFNKMFIKTRKYIEKKYPKEIR